MLILGLEEFLVYVLVENNIKMTYFYGCNNYHWDYNLYLLKILVVNAHIYTCGCICNIILAMEFHWYVQESGTVMGYSGKAVNEFKLGFDEEIEISFSFGYFEGFKYYRIYVFSLVV